MESGLCLSSETSYGCLTRVFLHEMLLLTLKSNRPFLSYCCLSLLNLGLLTVFVLVYFNSIYFLERKKKTIYLIFFFIIIFLGVCLAWKLYSVFGSEIRLDLNFLPSDQSLVATKPMVKITSDGSLGCFFSGHSQRLAYDMAPILVSCNYALF